MTQKTIQCRLVAPAATRQALWMLATEKNTPLINELIQSMVNHPDFETWRAQGKHPIDIVNALCKDLKTQPQFTGQPSRFYASAAKTVNYIFKSWFKIQKRLQQRLSGKQAWLHILSSDEELLESCGQSLDTLQKKARQILNQTTNAVETENASGPGHNRSRDRIRAELFKKHRSAKAPLTQCAIAYLLKHGCTLPEQPEDPQRFAQRRRKTERQVQRLQKQLEARIPKGRDLTGTAWLSVLKIATTTVPKDNSEHTRWQNQLLSHPTSIPFPILFESNSDLVWSLNQKGRKGLAGSVRAVTA